MKMWNLTETLLGLGVVVGAIVVYSGGYCNSPGAKAADLLLAVGGAGLVCHGVRKILYSD